MSLVAKNNHSHKVEKAPMHDSVHSLVTEAIPGVQGKIKSLTDSGQSIFL